MQKELVSLFCRVHLDDYSALRELKNVPSNEVAAFNREIGLLGYTFDKPVLDGLSKYPLHNFRSFRTDFLDLLNEVSGNHVSYKTLFNNFPYDTPEQQDYLLRRLIGVMEQNNVSLRNNTTSLSCGHIIDNNLFDLSEFGACPICQEQVDELDSPDVAVHKFQCTTPAKILRLADTAFIKKAAGNMLVRNSSLSAMDKEFLNKANEIVKLDLPSGKIFKETLPFVYDFFDDLEFVKSQLSGSTDVLRIAYYLSKSDDLSMKENVKFKISTKHKKRLLALLESLNNLEEDFMRNRERWLRLGETIASLSDENRRKFPKTAGAFERLRSSPKLIPTFNRIVEKQIRAKNINATLVVKMAERPGEFMRKLDFMLRTAEQTNGNIASVFAELIEVVKKIDLKRLFEMEKYILSRNTISDRVFVPKGKVNKMQVVPDVRSAISNDTLLRVAHIISAELIVRLSHLESMGKVYIDPALKNHLVPFNRRGDSSSVTQLVKGSRYKIPASDVYRLFVWWKEDTDVDLSFMAFDTNFKSLETISFRNLHSNGTYHSGDILSAPNGGSEFIDFETKTFKNRGIRYVVSSIISYRGQKFGTFPCFAGFMERDAMRSGHKYEPESMKLKFDLTASCTNYAPVIFDLFTNEVIFADLVMGNKNHTSMQDQTSKFKTMAQAVLNLPNTKPTLEQILTHHAQARGTIVTDPNDADLIFDADHIDMDQILKDYM